jgi:PilZ domain-containing protein
MSCAERQEWESSRRIEERHKVFSDLAVTYEGCKENVAVRVPDISTRGIFINTSRPFPEGAVLKVQFRLSRTNVVVKARGEVRYCLPGVGIGVEFVELSPEARGAIEKELIAVGFAPPSEP